MPRGAPDRGCTTLASETCHYGLNVFDAYVDFVCEGSVWKQTSFSSLQFDPIANCTAASGRAECLAFPGCSYRSGTWDQTTACGTSGAFEGCVSEEPCASSDQCWDPTACEPVTLTCAPGEPCPTMLCCEQVQ